MHTTQIHWTQAMKTRATVLIRGDESDPDDDADRVTAVKPGELLAWIDHAGNLWVGYDDTITCEGVDVGRTDGLVEVIDDAAYEAVAA